MKVLLVSDVGGTSYHPGDEAMLDAALEHLRRRGASRLTVISSDPADTGARYGVEAIGPIGFGSAGMAADPSGRDRQLAAVVEFPVFNSLATANHAAALLTYRQSQDQLESTRETVAVEVRRLVREVETNRKQIGAAGATRQAQEKRLDAERKKFEHGLSTNFEVSQAQKDVTDARSVEVAAITAYRRSLNALELVMGTVLDTYGVRIQE